MRDMNFRVSQRFQFSTDVFIGDNEAEGTSFESEIDYGVIHKNYENNFRDEMSYSHAKTTGVSLSVRKGNPVAT